ncbi:MAG: T9SS type A sorting domain-containing protein, partial [candidate division Zixibacteria bacterium]|nr:T9SS type A sorting domain-containing protein [candidate division Zixibacteria bacterium]
ETNYFKTINDTLYCKGVAFPGEPPQQANYIMTPQYPTLGSEWYSFWIESTVLFYVSDFTSVTVPAGTFDAYEYTITDSLTGEYIGTWYTSNGTGPVKWGMVQENDTIFYELNGYGLAGGYGAWPIEIGNHWTFYREGFTNIDNFNEIIIPSCITLNQNYPNPFNANTTIQYILPYQSEVRLEIFNILGQRVEKLLDTNQKSGQYSIIWDASGYSSGIYFYRLTTG